MRRPLLRDVSLVFLRIGNTTVGGGEPTIALLQQEMIRRGWLSPEQFGIAYALARITPGTNMLAFCAAAGWYVWGLMGALCAVLAVTVPIQPARDLVDRNLRSRRSNPVAGSGGERRRRSGAGHYDLGGDPSGPIAMVAIERDPSSGDRSRGVRTQDAGPDAARDHRASAFCLSYSFCAGPISASTRVRSDCERDTSSRAASKPLWRSATWA